MRVVAVDGAPCEPFDIDEVVWLLRNVSMSCREQCDLAVSLGNQYGRARHCGVF